MVKTTKSHNIGSLKRSLEEAEILKSGMKLVLMNPALDSDRKGEYEKAFSKLDDEIRDIKIMMGYIRKNRSTRSISSSWSPAKELLL